MLTPGIDSAPNPRKGRVLCAERSGCGCGGGGGGGGGGGEEEGERGGGRKEERVLMLLLAWP